MKWEVPAGHLVKLNIPLDAASVKNLSDEALLSLLKAGKYDENRVCYRASDRFLLRNIAGEYVLVPTDGVSLNGMITFNETGNFLWNLLQKPATVQDLVFALRREYSVPEDPAQADVELFLNRAQQCGMIERCPD